MCICFVDNSVLRVPILYGKVENLDESAVTVLFKKVQDTSQKCMMSDYERRCPTYCDDIAIVIRQLAEKRLSVCIQLTYLLLWKIMF